MLRSDCGAAELTATESSPIEDKHSWDRVPRWDGDKRERERYLRDVVLYLETEELNVDFSHGARLLSKLTGSTKKFADTV